MSENPNPFIPMTQLHTRLWRNCLEGVDEDLAWQRPDARANDFGFIALHLVDARHYILKLLNVALENPFGDRYEAIHSADDLNPEDRPGLDALRSAWDQLSMALQERLPQVTAEELAQVTAVPFPIPGNVGDALTFLLHHEAYHLGQLALLRKFLGLESMKYD